jgi:2-polyprenyl-6-methoxyphenol hydroxylase-like FAD-dependent oxidoreductase
MPQAAVSSPRSQPIVVMGGGIGGLASALTLSNSGREVLVLERDAPPPELAPTAAFDRWKRPGVPQFHHTHIFLARLQSILSARHPQLMSELLDVGLERSSLEHALSPPQLERYAPQAGDEKLVHIWGRRATFEYVLRRHVGRLPNVQFMHGRTVESIAAERVGDDLRVTGVQLRAETGTEFVQAEFVVDALGVRSQSVETLNALGAGIRTERVPSRCGYYCRHFQQRDPSTEPPRRGYGATLDYLVYGLFFAEHGSFSIAFTCPEDDPELLQAIKRAPGFDEACRQIPALQRWTSRAEPTSRVLGGADLANRWYQYARGTARTVLGFFPVGDSYIQTNPIYGRGCSSGFVQAHALATAIEAERDPRARARAYHRDVWVLMRPHFGFCTVADAGFLARAKAARTGEMTRSERLASSAFERVFLPAIEDSPFVMREWLRLQQMAEGSSPWVVLLMLLRMAMLWLMRMLTRNRWQLPRLGPSRDDMVRACGTPNGAPSIPPGLERSDNQFKAAPG